MLASARLLDDVDNARSKLLNGGDVVGEDTHVSGLSWDIDLDTVYGWRGISPRDSILYLPVKGPHEMLSCLWRGIMRGRGGRWQCLHVGGLEDRLYWRPIPSAFIRLFQMHPKSIQQLTHPYLVRQRQGEPDLVRWAGNVGVGPDGPGNWGASSESQARGNSKGVHCMSVR